MKHHTTLQSNIPAHLVEFFADNDNWESSKAKPADWGRKVIDRLHELYVYDPETGRLISRRTGGFLAGRVIVRDGRIACRQHLIRITPTVEKTMTAHRMVWAMVHNEWPSLEVDHIDGDPLNNRIENLRLADYAENSRNRAMPRSNTTGITGVVIHKKTGKWQAQSGIQRGNKIKMVYLGLFDNLLDAAAARKSYELHHGFSERHGQPARSAA